MQKTKACTQDQLLFNNLIDFYQNQDYLTRMIEVIDGRCTNKEGKHVISRRIVDWFVTNFAKKYYTVYDLVNPKTGESKRFKVYSDYRSKLTAYSKKNFDPFCRWDRISIPYGDDSQIETTLGQLNFFKWAIQNKVIEYIQDHYDEISEDMLQRNSNSRKKEPTDANTGTRKKREELSISACQSIHKENIRIVLKFN